MILYSIILNIQQEITQGGPFRHPSWLI